jgi:hypothetical protein
MNLVPNLHQYAPTTVNGAIAVGIAVGTLYCFLGYRTLRFVLCLTGFGLAGAVAGGLAAWLSQGDALWSSGAMVFGGLCGAFAMVFLYRTGVFLVGMLAAALIAQNALTGSEAASSVWALLGAAALGGVLALVIERFVMTVATAAIGAWLVVCGVGFFLVGPSFLDVFQEPLEAGHDRGVALLCWTILAVAGALAQFATTKRRVRTQP